MATEFAGKRRKNQEVSSLDRSLAKLIDHKYAPKPRDEVRDIVLLAEQFKNMSVALDSKIKAASHCPKFVQFLDVEEKQQLEEYNSENRACST